MAENKIPYKIYLDEKEIPSQWYNVRADMKNKPAPLLNPATLQPMKAEELYPNVPILLEGNMPIEENECVVEKNVLTKLNKAIGDTIQLETEEKSKIKEKNLKIVGIVQSPLYISRDRGTTTLASGKIDFYVYVKPENINEDVYTRNLYKNK